MKRHIVFSLLVLFIYSCSKDNNGSENTCPTPTISTNPQGSSVTIELSGAPYGFLEIEYGSNGFSRGSGTTVTTSSSHTLNNLPDGTYDIYARGNCGGSNWSAWSAVRSFLIQGGISSSCPQPQGLGYYYSLGHNLHWNYIDEADYYEIEYGQTGFTLGSGTKGTSNNESYTITNTLSSNHTYDFYVRTNCGGSEYSAWTGPSSFFVQ